VVLVAAFALVVLVAPAVFGGDTRLASGGWGGLKLLRLVGVVATLGAAVVRCGPLARRSSGWVRWTRRSGARAWPPAPSGAAERARQGDVSRMDEHQH
jgi:hypothetical protein